MKKRNLLSILLMLFIGFSACEKEEIQEEQGGDETTTVRLIKQIKLFGDEGEEFSLDISYNSQDSRIIEIIASGGDIVYSTTTYTYPSENTMIWKVEYEDGDEFNENITFNSDGSIASFADGTSPIKYSNGYLQEIEESLGSGKKYTWDNENIKTMEESGTYTLEYGALLNKPISIDIVHCLLIVDDMYPMAWGWLGKSTKNLPVKVSYAVEGYPEDNEVKVYRYETDSEGYITKIHQRINNGVEELMLAVKYE